MANPYQHYYLLDACAFGEYIGKLSNRQVINHDMLANIVSGSFYYIPQFCVAEIFNMFAKWHYAEKKIGSKRYEQLCELFKDMIRNRKILYPYDLHRYHNLNCDKIYKHEHTTPKGSDSKLSTFDILIIAMGIELQHIHGKDNLTILSCDKRLIKISNIVGVTAENFN